MHHGELLIALIVIVFSSGLFVGNRVGRKRAFRSCIEPCNN